MPLMGGKAAQKEHITGAFRIIEKAKDISEEDVRRLEEVIYTMADKFLEKIDLDEVRSEMRMTELGKMLYKEAEKKVKLESAKNLLGILNDELIAEKIGIPLEDVLKLKEEMKQNIDYKTGAVYKMVPVLLQVKQEKKESILGNLGSTSIVAI